MDKLDLLDLYNDDCFNILPKLENNSVDLFLLDLPYANLKFGKCTNCKWDTPIDLDKMWIEIKRIMKPNAIIVFFCDVKFGYCLIDSNPKWFKYDLIFKKGNKKVGFLSANKRQLRNHENIYIFNNGDDDIELIKNKELRKYSEKVLLFINKSKKEIINKIGQSVDHFFRFKSSQYFLCSKKTYNKLIDIYKINEMKDFLEYDSLKKLEEINTYNPQIFKGKPYKTKGIGKIGVYDTKRIDKDNKGTRNPTSILDYNPPHKTIHPTQKPVALIEYLIKTYSNENNTVCDFCMGSGTAAIGCINTNRKFIGVEKDKEIYDLCENRILDYLQKL